ncbi:hypothetical protein BHE74_00016914 [Ensete ventricosum]|nr:hypothetical protein BHE74_00016914 [Ensete ventricosum]
MHERNSTLRIANKELKIGFGSKVVEAVEKQATELQSEVKWLKAELGTSEQHRKDLELVVNSVDAELLEVRDSRHRLEDEILSLTKNVELLQSELKAEGGKVMTKYKASSGFQVELEKMGQVGFNWVWSLGMVSSETKSSTAWALMAVLRTYCRYSSSPDLKVILGSCSYRGLFSITVRAVVGKARHIKAYDIPYNAICALNAATCSIGLPSYASCIRRPKCYRIGLSRTSNTKGDPPMLLSPSSSFDLTNSFWTSSICWFIKRNYARSESLKSEERVFGSSMLWIEVLTMGVHRPVASSGAMGLLLR